MDGLFADKGRARRSPHMQTSRLTHETVDASLTYRRDGAERFAGVLSPDALRDVTGITATDRPGTRLYGMGAALAPILSASGSVGSRVAAIQGPDSRPVRAVLFDKKTEMNWGLGWHQDRTIAVTERVEVLGFGPWTVKDGALHVAPPFEVLAGMITVRIHIDDVPETNAPLLIAPGSHRFGRIPEADVANTVQKCGTYACVAEAGDMWLYATPILHASKVSQQPSRRRVLQVDYAACDLPDGLRWLGI